jgi:hypothetical protein
VYWNNLLQELTVYSCVGELMGQTVEGVLLPSAQAGRLGALGFVTSGAILTEAGQIALRGEWVKNNLLLKLMLIGCLVCAGVGLSGCGRSVKGTYADTTGSYVLNVKSGSAATLTFLGASTPCTYAVSGDQLYLDCHGQSGKVAFTIHNDGSLTGPPGTVIPALRKAKS